MAEKKHWADRPILRDLFWFLVLPYRAGQWLKHQRTAGVAPSRGGQA